jgi:sec-independent protein translocase protein TatB
MFDIGFWELIIIALVALIIIGPERLPDFARDAGRLLNKMRRFIQSTKREIERELELEEVNDLHKSIKHVDGLMQEAPDRIILDQMKNDESDSAK